MTESTIIRSSNPGDPQRRVIGEYVLDQDEEFTRSYEVAAWSTKILVPAGRYEAVTNGYYVFVSLPGTVTESYTPNLFGGVAYESRPQGREHRDVGQATTHGIQVYAYEVARAVGENRTDRWVLAPGIVAESEDFDTYRLVRCPTHEPRTLSISGCDECDDRGYVRQPYKATSWHLAEQAEEPDETFAITYLGHVIDVFDTEEQARAERALLVKRIKAGQLSNFLDADDIDGVEDFGIRRGDFS